MSSRPRVVESVRPAPTAPRSLADFLLVLPLDRSVLDVVNLERHLVEHIFRAHSLLHNGGDLTFQRVLGGGHVPHLRPALGLVQAALVLPLQFLDSSLHFVGAADKAHLAALNQLRLDRVQDGFGVNVLAGLVAHSGDGHCGTSVGDGAFQQGTNHLLRDHLEIGRTELVCHRLDGLAISVRHLPGETHRRLRKLRWRRASGEHGCAQHDKQRGGQRALRDVHRHLHRIQAGSGSCDQRASALISIMNSVALGLGAVAFRYCVWLPRNSTGFQTSPSPTCMPPESVQRNR